MLYHTPLEPVFDEDFSGQWAGYEAYNAAFADALAQEADDGAAVLVQDYHLALVPGMLRARRPTCGSATSRTRRGRPPTTSGCSRTTSPRRCCAACSAPTAPRS